MITTRAHLKTVFNPFKMYVILYLINVCKFNYMLHSELDDQFK